MSATFMNSISRVQGQRIAWKEETRAAHSQTQQEQHRALDSHFSPSLSTYVQERLALLQEGENRGTLLAL